MSAAKAMCARRYRIKSNQNNIEQLKGSLSVV